MASEKLSTLLHADTEKTAPVNADEVPILDSADSFKFAKVTWANVKATLVTYFDTLYSAIGHAHSGVYEPVDATILKQADVDDTPVNGVTTAPVSSNWAYDHAALTEAHGISSFGASLVDDADAGTARTTLGLGTAATTAATDYATAAQGSLAASAVQPGGALGTPASGTLTNCTGYPIPAVKLDDAAAPDDNTDLNASATAHGLLPKLANTGTKYLRDDGTWQTISSGDVVGPSSSTDNTIPRFDSTTGKLIQGSVAILGDDGTFYLEGIAGQTTGSARGAGAIDLQTSRDSASKVASGANSIALGYRNTASGLYSVALGNDNVSSQQGTVAVGHNNTASHFGSVALGRLGASFTESQMVLGSTAASCGVILQSLKLATTDATPATMTAYTTAMAVPARSAIAFDGLIVAKSDNTDGHKTKAWKVTGLVARDGANSTRVVGTPTVAEIAADTEASSWSLAVAADDTNERLNFTATGEAATNIQWQGALVVAISYKY